MYQPHMAYASKDSQLNDITASAPGCIIKKGVYLQLHVPILPVDSPPPNGISDVSNTGTGRGATSGRGSRSTNTRTSD